MTRAMEPHTASVGRDAPADAAPPIVRMVGVCKSFGAQKVLIDLNLEIQSGLTTVVLGPSGSGKSVILKHIVALLRADKGEIWFRDQRIDQLSERELGPVRRQIGFLFQQGALFDSMTVRENLEFPLIEHTQADPADRRRRVAEALSMVDLSGVEPKYPAQLSGGQQKRVALARAIILNPALILYDEPTTGLDPVRSDGISDLILKLRNELGVSGVVVTHDLACARKAGDRIVMIGDGHVIFAGTMSELEAAEDPRVRNFVTGHAGGEGDLSDR